MERRESLLNSLLILFSFGMITTGLIFTLPNLNDWWREYSKGHLAIDDPAFLYKNAERYYQLGDLGMAHDVANRAIIVDPGYLPAHKLVAAIFIKQRKYTDAEKVIRKAAAIDPNDNDIKLALGMTLKNQGRIAEAEKVYRQVGESKNRDLLQNDEVLTQLQAMEDYAAGKATPCPSPSPSPRSRIHR
jgi:tetratricopeptide (TPR) repeat protein